MYRPLLILVYSLFHVQCSGHFRHGLVKKDSRGVGGTNVLASVREYPSELHKCTASFVRPDVLLTIAACIYSEDPDKLFVRASSKHLSDKLDDKGISYFISDIVTHPNFVKTPIGNDVGLIFLKNKVNEVTTFSLPQVLFLPETNIPANIFQWKFSDNRKDYYLHYAHVTTISSAKCSIVFGEYIDGQHICVEGDRDIIMGSYDKGSPLTTRNKNNPFILGLYDRKGRSTRLLIEVFQSIVPFVGWINAVINDHGGNNTITTPANDNSVATTIIPDAVTSQPDSSTFIGEISVSSQEAVTSPNGPVTTPSGSVTTTPGGPVTTQNVPETSSETDMAPNGPDTTPAGAEAVSGETNTAPNGPSTMPAGADTTSNLPDESSRSAAEGPDTTPASGSETPPAAGTSSAVSGTPQTTPGSPVSTPQTTTSNLKIESPDNDAFDYDTIKVPLFESGNLGSSYAKNFL